MNTVQNVKFFKLQIQNLIKILALMYISSVERYMGPNQRARRAFGFMPVTKNCYLTYLEL